MNRERFISLVKASEKALRRFLVALCCGDTMLADDIAQETYIKAFLSAETLSDTGKFNAWIYRIGYTTFLNCKRSERIQVDVDSAGSLEAADSADSAFDYQDLYHALGRLPVKERMSILLFYLESYSVKEIASLQNISQDAVKQHLSRGRAHLREYLTPKSTDYGK